MQRRRIIAAITLAIILASAARSYAQEGGPAPAGVGSPFSANLPIVVGPAPTPTQPLVTAEAQSVLDATNAERVAAGCPALTLNAKLSQAAQLHAQDMLLNDFFSHTGSDGATIGTRVTRQGYHWRRVGENIAAGYPTASSTVEGWMSSPGHRQNLLNCSYTEMGVGYLYDPGDPGSQQWGYYWVQVFATPQ